MRRLSGLHATPLSPLFVNVTPVPPPDLVVQSVNAPLDTFDGSSITVRYRVANLGAGVTRPARFVNSLTTFVTFAPASSPCSSPESIGATPVCDCGPFQVPSAQNTIRFDIAALLRDYSAHEYVLRCAAGKSDGPKGRDRSPSSGVRIVDVQRSIAMAKVLVPYQSSWGHMEQMAHAAAGGARAGGAQVIVKRVAEIAAKLAA